MWGKDSKRSVRKLSDEIDDGEETMLPWSCFVSENLNGWARKERCKMTTKRQVQSPHTEQK